jgi:sugar transferase EpsL
MRSLYRILKRVIDLTVATFGLLVLSLPAGFIALLIRMTSPGTVFFRQPRAGLHGQPFTLLKFRTMLDAKDSKGNLLPDGQRLTRLGRFLRDTSLDELPELINVLKGEMSLVGPRPLLLRYLARYTPQQNRRHEVKPGITGWAQINGRNALAWEQKFALDVWYVEHRSVFLDAKIIFLTAWKILKREGINQPGRATAEEFMGLPPVGFGG